MNKKRITALAACLLLAGCQVAPVNATTTITSSEGAGSKTISALVLVDGSCQIDADLESFPGNTSYYRVDNIDFTNLELTPKADGAKVRLYHDGYLTNPNGKATCKEVWEEFNGVVESYVPEGFEFKCTEVKSANWTDDYMETVPDATVSEWKGYVYSVTYSWANVEEYISKTKTLIGADAYEISQLKEMEDAGLAWAKFETLENNQFKWSEAWYVNYWSVYGTADKVMGSEYFNKAALGAEFAITTENAFSISLQQFTIGESESVTIKVDNTSGSNEDLSVKMIEATGTITPAPVETPEAPNNTTTVIIIAAAAAVVLAAGLFFILKKKK